MRTPEFGRSAGYFLVMLILSFASASAQTYKVIHDFGGSGDGKQPVAHMIFDPQGNLYGTTLSGGPLPSSYGTVFELSPNGDGTWTESIVHSFNDSNDAQSEPMAMDQHGNLYGETGGNGIGTYGSVYELSPAGGGTWTLRTLYAFSGGTDGAFPSGGVVLSSDSNHIYGVGRDGVTRHDGFIFSLNHVTAASWGELVLYSFRGGNDGLHPGGPLTLDPSGNLFGVAAGGQYNDGTVFKLSPNRHSFGWSKSLVYAFQNPDGTPNTGLLLDGAGNLYGASFESGTYNQGTVYKLSPNPDGSYTETVLHEFQGLQHGDGGYVNGNLVMDPAGNIYGTTQGGGMGGYRCGGEGCGTVYKLTPSGNGLWTETILYEFSDVSGGWQPHASLVRDAAGNLFGTTIYGGANESGVAFEVTP